MLFYEDSSLRIETPASRDPSIARVWLMGQGEGATSAVNQLIDENDIEAPYLFAGRHGGMPRQVLWAMSREGNTIDPYIDSIVRKINQVWPISNIVEMVPPK